MGFRMLEQDVSSIQTRNGVGFFRARHLEATGRISHAFSTRFGGVSPPPFDSLNLSTSTGDKTSCVRKNKNILMRTFGLLPSVLLTVNQVHGDSLLIIDSPLPPVLSEAAHDAIVTDRPGIAIGVLTADCVPVLLHDPERPAIAAVHVGWKGTALNLCGKTIQVFEERFGTRPENLLVAVGPSIGPCCYEVDEFVRRAFSRHEGRWQKWAKPQAPSRWRLDLPRANVDLMTSAGVSDENIVWFNACTHCREDLFFSHRRDGGVTGRQISFVMME